jgi:hypothetical protein
MIPGLTKVSEYKRVSDALGASNIEALSLACNLPPPWYFVLARTLFMDYPMVRVVPHCRVTVYRRTGVSQAMYSLTLPWSTSSSSSSIATIALFQHASVTFRQTMESLRGSQCPFSIIEIINQIRTFYETVEYKEDAGKGAAVDYPNYWSCSKGMRVSFR